MKRSGYMNARVIQKRLRKLQDRQKAELLRRFFKTGPGEYGEGDIFLGIQVPALRKIAREYEGLPLHEMQELLGSPVHEERLLSLILLVRAYPKGDDKMKRKIYMFYLRNTKHINNWDLVDISAEHIVGAYLRDKTRNTLYRLVQSRLIWNRRIAMLATFHFIKQNEYNDTLKIARLLLSDKEDLIHKAVGWMLREVGKRDQKTEEEFLREHYKSMPRTMLRYAIERFPEPLRMKYLRGKI
jgi:3-methyladenine DNA glycosylase AlkD